MLIYGKTNYILMLTAWSLCMIHTSCSDDFLTDLNQGTSLIYWSENNGNGNEDEFFREWRALDKTMQNDSVTLSHPHENSLETNSLVRESEQLKQFDQEPISGDANSVDTEEDTRESWCCIIS